jgi:hypothetical protein
LDAPQGESIWVDRPRTSGNGQLRGVDPVLDGKYVQAMVRGPAVGAMLFVAITGCGGLLATDDAPVGPSDASSLEASGDSTVTSPDGDDSAAATDTSVEASSSPEASAQDAADASMADDATESGDAGDAADAPADSPIDAPRPFCDDACALGDQECSPLPQVCTYDDAGHTVGCQPQGQGVWTCVTGSTGCSVWASGVACSADIPCCVTCEQGVCPLGSLGDPCRQDTDCASDACDAVAHVCISSRCADHRQDGDEADVDCGGSLCDSCQGGQRCRSNGDCQPGHVCLGGSVRLCSGSAPPPADASATDAASCSDECAVGDQGCSLLPQVCTYDDAGFTASCDAPGEGHWTCVLGSAGCAVWAPGASCGSAAACCAGCAQVACDAGAGPLCWSCPPGSDGRPCEQDTECVSGACDAVGHECVSGQCADHRQDGVETDVDCGGPVCAPCGVGQGCQSNRDCQPGHVCVNNGYRNACR